MHDLFALAGGAVSGLWLLAVAPWTPQWWIALVLATVLLLASITSLLRRNLIASNRLGARSLLWLSLSDAARKFYEAMERHGIDAMTEPGFSSAQVPLDHFKYVLLADHKKGLISLYAARSPSSKSRLIPRDLVSRLMPDRSAPNAISTVSRASPIEFRNVVVSRFDLRRAIRHRVRLIENANRGLAHI